jgi:hypothetical protein
MGNRVLVRVKKLVWKTFEVLYVYDLFVKKKSNAGFGGPILAQLRVETISILTPFFVT